MSAAKKCPTCQSELAAEAVDGLCLKCLGRLAFFSDATGLLRLGDYELLEEIARGGMGVVYRARQLSLNRLVALKVLLQGPFSSRDFVQRFRQEARAVAALRHPNIVAIHEVGEHDGNHFLALEFVEGGNFAELVRERPLPARRAAGYLQSIALAIEHAHQRGVLHRDLKPSNILLDVFDQPRVTDFGLAKLANQDAALTVTGEVLGSPNYMPPEQAGGNFANSTATSDVYSLGAILYELITGRAPFQGETLQAILARVQDSEPVPPRRLVPGIPVDLQTICLKCLQKDPARRYDTAQALAEDLGRFLEGQPVLARPVSRLERLWLWARRRPQLAALSGALILVALLGLAGILWEWGRAERHAEGERQQRVIAEQDAAQTRLNLYAADVAVAALALQNGHPGPARRTLGAWRPAAGEADLRDFEWYYLWQRSAGDELAVMPGHRLTVSCVAFSPDGRLLATGSHDGTVCIWNPDQHSLFTSLKVTSNAVWSVAFTPDGRWLVAGCNQNVQFWDTTSWQKGPQYPGQLAALSATGTLLATADSSPFFWEPAGPVRLYDWRTGQLQNTLNQPGRSVAFSFDGSRLAVAGANSGITIYDTANGQGRQTLPTAAEIWSVNFSPDGRRLLATSWSTNAFLWALDHPGPPALLSGHLLHVWSAVFSADGNTIATTSSDQTVRLWNAGNLASQFILHGGASEIWCAAFRPDGRLLATGGKDQNVLLWPTSVNPPLRELPHDTDYATLFSPDGGQIVTVKPGRGNSEVWRTADLSLVNSNAAGGNTVIGYSRDGKAPMTFNSDRCSLEFWPPPGSTAPPEVRLGGMVTNQTQFAYAGVSPEREWFFAIDAAGRIRIWDATTGRLRQTITGPVPPIRKAVLGPYGKKIAVSVAGENLAHLYDCATRTEHLLTGYRDFVSGLAFSPDGGTLAAGSMDGSIRLWNTARGECRATLPGHLTEATDVAFSPDGRTLASVGHGESLKLWPVPTLREVYSETDPHAGLWLQFSPDGRELAVGKDNDRVRLLAAPRD